MADMIATMSSPTVTVTGRGVVYGVNVLVGEVPDAQTFEHFSHTSVEDAVRQAEDHMQAIRSGFANLAAWEIAHG